MPSPRLPDSRRERVARQAELRCEYCRSPSDCSASSFSVEHIEPRSRGGSDDDDNLAWSCMGCNDRKYTAVDAIDPVSGEVVPLFHPRKQVWAEHFLWAADFTQIVGQSPTGRATVARLKLNRPELVKLRQILRIAGEHPPAGESGRQSESTMR